MAVTLKAEFEVEEEEIRAVELAAVEDPKKVVEFPPEISVNIELLTEVELAVDAIFTVLFKATEVILALLEFEEKAVMLAFNPGVWWRSSMRNSKNLRYR